MGLQKQPRYINRKLLDLAKGMPCMHCGIEDGTVVAAHSDSAIHGKGKGMKSHDLFVAFLCHHCHAWYDADYGTMSGYSSKREDKLEFWRRAHEQTMLTLWRNGKIKVTGD